MVKRNIVLSDDDDTDNNIVEEVKVEKTNKSTRNRRVSIDDKFAAYDSSDYDDEYSDGAQEEPEERKIGDFIIEDEYSENYGKVNSERISILTKAYQMDEENEIEEEEEGDNEEDLVDSDDENYKAVEASEDDEDDEDDDEVWSDYTTKFKLFAHFTNFN